MTSTLVLYTLDEVFENYPAIQRRGWTKEHFQLWLEQDIIGGVLGQDMDSHRIEKDSLDDFIAYHNAFILKRVEKMEDGIENIKNN
jgi:hypothetical protein